VQPSGVTFWPSNAFRLDTAGLDSLLISQGSVFQPGFRGSSGFREWLPEVPPKQTEIAWDEIRNHSYMRFRGGLRVL